MRVFRSSYRKHPSAGEGSLFCFVYTAGMLCEMIASFYLSRTQAVNIPALRPCSSAANNLSPETISRPSWLPDSILTLITYREQSLYNERENRIIPAGLRQRMHIIWSFIVKLQPRSLNKEIGHCTRTYRDCHLGIIMQAATYCVLK